jgi:putative transcriptional regulator
MTSENFSDTPFRGLTPGGGYMEGQLLVATNLITESCFYRSVIYICTHDQDGAIGIIINRHLNDLTLTDVIKQFKITMESEASPEPVYMGGPVNPARGLVIHSTDYKDKSTVRFKSDIAITSNLQVLRDIAVGKGPKKSLLALGYAGWEAGQLEAEIEANSWITVPASSKLVFDTDDKAKWEQAAKSLGIDMFKLSGDVGHA